MPQKGLRMRGKGASAAAVRSIPKEIHQPPCNICLGLACLLSLLLTFQCCCRGLLQLMPIPCCHCMQQHLHLELSLMQVFSFLHLPVLVSHFSLAVLQILFGNLPEGIDFVLQPFRQVVCSVCWLNQQALPDSTSGGCPDHLSTVCYVCWLQYTRSSCM